MLLVKQILFHWGALTCLGMLLYLKEFDALIADHTKDIQVSRIGCQVDEGRFIKIEFGLPRNDLLKIHDPRLLYLVLCPLQSILQVHSRLTRSLLRHLYTIISIFLWVVLVRWKYCVGLIMLEGCMFLGQKALLHWGLIVFGLRHQVSVVCFEILDCL